MITRKDIEDLNRPFRSLSDSDLETIARVKVELLRGFTVELRNAPKSWFLELGSKTLSVNFTLVSNNLSDDEDSEI